MTSSTAPRVEQTTLTFSAADYSTDPGKVIKHAAETGKAVVVAEDGRTLVVIRIPTVDLPPIDD
ncbi:MAG: hypothetical protein JNM17_03910 [Archangium sp.]|nr:hypothetical protein [Archangium sp.]